MKYLLAALLLATAANAGTSYEYRTGSLGEVKTYCYETGGNMIRDYGCAISYPSRTWNNPGKCEIVVNNYYSSKRAKIIEILKARCER